MFDNIIISVYIVVSAVCEKLLPVPAQKQKLSETSFSILSEVMGINRLRARTINGFLLKTYPAVLALVFHITLVIN